MTTPLTCYDLTVAEHLFTKDEMMKFLQTNCKKWCFQLEQGNETEYRHYQCRLSLMVKRRVSTMIKFIQEKLPGAHASPTSNPTFYSGNEFYVMKEDTRIDGPWSDRNTIDENSIPSRFRNNITWKNWQESVIKNIENKPDDRHINVIIDPDGGHGKTFLALYLQAHKKARLIPPQKESKDILRMVCNCPTSTCYFVDIPRAESKNNQHALFSALECVKNGYVFDDRYHFTEKMFEPPHVWVFTNHKPDVHLLSQDRWVFHTIINNKLVGIDGD